MIKLNTEYTYKEICNELGWNIQSGNNRIKQKQIKTLEESYEFYHPENKKTHKPKKSYVFTKQLKEPILVDMRKNNGGVRENAGKKNLFPDEEFDYLLDNILHTGENRNKYNHEGGYVNNVYVSTSLIYQEFGIDIYTMLNDIKYSDRDINKKVKRLFKNICIDIVKSYTITRICKKYGCSKNSLPKGILRKRGKRAKGFVADDKLLDKFNEYEKKILEKRGFKTIQDAIENEKYFEIYNEIQEEFEKEGIYGIQRCNVISFDYCKFKFVYDSKKRELYQSHFRQVVFDAIKKSVDNRINETKEYKHKLTDCQKRILQNYLNQLLGKETKFNDYDYVDYVSNNDTELIELFG